MITFAAVLPYLLTLHLIIMLWLIWVLRADGAFQEGGRWARLGTWVMTILWEITAVAAFVFFLLDLCKDAIRRERLLGAPKEEYGVETWKLAVGYVTVCVTVTILCVLIIV